MASAKGRSGSSWHSSWSPQEEAEVAEADDFGAAFSLYFQVFAGAHRMVEGAYGEACEMLFFGRFGEFPHSDEYGGSERLFVLGRSVDVLVSFVLSL